MRRLAYSLATLAVLLAVVGAASVIWLHPNGGGDVGFAIVGAFIGVAGAVTGAPVVASLPRNAVGWLVLGEGVGAGLTVASEAYAAVGVRGPHTTLPGQQVIALVGEMLGTLVLFGVTGMLLLLFPTGQALTSRWRPFVWFFGVLVCVAAVSTSLLSPTSGLGVPNGSQVHGRAAELTRSVANLTDVLGPPALLLCAVCLVVRLRRSHGIQRQQLKWFTYCAAVAGIGLGLSIVPSGPMSDVAFLIGTAGIISMPVTAAIAILRHQLYDIDVVINRTLVYGALTAVLVATYLVSVLAFRAVLDPLTGTSDLAVAVSTLAVAALFRPMRSRIQATVDRRFYRRRYNAVLTLEEFSGRLRHEVDLDSLGVELRSVVHETMQPAHVTLWLRREP